MSVYLIFMSTPVKGKLVEKQGRKISGLRGKTYDSGVATGFLVGPLIIIREQISYM